MQEAEFKDHYLKNLKIEVFFGMIYVPVISPQYHVEHFELNVPKKIYKSYYKTW